jgi:glycine/serine hydroxymethyltransferase
MVKIAHFIGEIARDYEASKDRITAEVMALCEKFPIYE